MKNEANIPKESKYVPVEKYEQLQAQNRQQEQDIAFLKMQLDDLKRQMFGQKSERYVPENSDQMRLPFAGLNSQEQPSTIETEHISYTRNKKGNKGKAKRLLFPEHLPRETEVIELDHLPEGAKKIGELVTEVLAYQPGRLYVRRLVRYKYLVSTDENTQTTKIQTPELPTDLPIPKGNATACLLAYLLTSKYIDHLPFYRLVQIFKREGFSPAESTINGWFKAAGILLEPLYDLLLEKLLKSDYLQADETVRLAMAGMSYAVRSMVVGPP